MEKKIAKETHIIKKVPNYQEKNVAKKPPSPPKK